jgi:riboflavin synthase
MFTGIVEERGAVLALEAGRLSIGCRVVVADSPIGASVAVNGTCLTVVAGDDDHLAFDLSDETVARTSLRRLAPGHPVNLERPVTLAARLGGHIVQGHVDGVGEVVAIDPGSDGGALLRVGVPDELLRYAIHKGSITIDGVSLTVATLHEDAVTIALIPHTLTVTTLGIAAVGDPVNLEMDMIAKYVERLMERS